MATARMEDRNFIPGEDANILTVVAPDALDYLPDYMGRVGLKGNAFIITDSNVYAEYGETVSEILNEKGVANETLVMPAGEEHKTIEQAQEFIKALADMKATRNDTIIALGGGVVGDLGGFVASVYNRGVPLVHVPTTVLAMVDSSIGGKTGVDLGGKNKTGTFYQPRLIVADPYTLDTLSPEVYTEGFGEIAKYGILDPAIMRELDETADTIHDRSTDQTVPLIMSCMRHKFGVVTKDPREQDPTGGRVLLNYGHTLAHGLEVAGNYQDRHGNAVAIGMNFAAQLSAQLGHTSEALVDEQTQLLERLGLPTVYEREVSIEDVIDNIAKDKKNTGHSSTRFVLPEAVGALLVTQVDNTIVRKAVESFLADGKVAI